MPFADGGGGVALTLKHIGQRELVGPNNHARIARCNIGVVASPSIFAREQRVARWGARGGNGVAVGELDARLCEPIDMGRLNSFGTIALQIAVAQIVG